MNFYNEVVLTSIAHSSEYEGECTLESKKLSELSESEEEMLLSYLMGKHNSLIKKRLEIYGFLPLAEIKEEKGIIFTDRDKFFFLRNFRMEAVCQNEKLSEQKLKTIAGEYDCFVAVKTPKFIQKQLDAYQKQKELKKKHLEETKLARKLKKAKKLLEKSGEL